MIIDSIKNAANYSALHPNLIKGIDFIRQNADTIPVGKYILDGDDLFVMVVETDLKEASLAYLEAHKEYIDVQVVIKGCEIFAWADISNCISIKEQYNQTNDIIFFNDRPTTYINAIPGQFLVFFPEDAHAPLIGQGKIRKAVIKVKVKSAKIASTTTSSKANKIAYTDDMTLDDEQIAKYNALKQWRHELCTAESIPPYFIASDRELKSVVISNATQPEDLMNVKGFAERKIETYGKDIIAVMNSI